MRLRDSRHNIGALFEHCNPISLEETNRRAKMLSRTDNKYIVSFTEFQELLACIQNEYRVLEIDGLNQFSYASCYYDDDYSCYFEHHQSRRQRFKVRTREYLDSGLMFFEIKLKGTRGKTKKHRIPCQQLVMPSIQGDCMALLRREYETRYRKPMRFMLKPALFVTYRRCTLVAVNGGERVTIDYSLGFNAPHSESEPVRIGSDFIIVETKSRDGKGVADTALRQRGIRKARKCSKYCIGLNLTGRVSKNNNFLHTIKHVRANIIASTQLPLVAAR